MAIEVVIHPFEKIADHLLNAVRAAIEERFGLQATIGEELAAPAQAYSRERGQYLSLSFLDELGHVFNLSHCPRSDCVMWFSNTLAETDRKGTQFCPRHFQELRQAMR